MKLLADLDKLIYLLASVMSDITSNELIAVTPK